jgi:hypothetical protein
VQFCCIPNMADSLSSHYLVLKKDQTFVNGHTALTAKTQD